MIAPKRSGMHRPVITTTPLPHPVAPQMTQGRRGRYFERRYTRANVAPANTAGSAQKINATHAKPMREARVQARKDSILRELGMRNAAKHHARNRLYSEARNTSTSTRRVSVLQIRAANPQDIAMPKTKYNYHHRPREDNVAEIYNFYYPNASLHLNEHQNTTISVASQYEINQTKRLFSTEENPQNVSACSRPDNSNDCWICQQHANRNAVNYPYHCPPTTPSVQQGSEGAMMFRYSTQVGVPSWTNRKDAIVDALLARHSTGNMPSLTHKKSTNDMRARHQLIMEQHRQSVERSCRKSTTPALNVRNTRPHREGFSDRNYSEQRLFTEKTSLMLHEKHKELDLKAILAVQKSNDPPHLQGSNNIHNKSFLPPLGDKSKQPNNVKLQPSRYIGYDDIHRSASSSSEIYNRQLAASTHACYAQIIESLPQSNSYMLSKFLEECHLDTKLSGNKLEALQADLDSVFTNKREQHNSRQKTHHKSSAHIQNHIHHDQKLPRQSFDIVIPVCEILHDREASQASSNISDVNRTCGNNMQTPEKIAQYAALQRNPEKIAQYSELPKQITDIDDGVNQHVANNGTVLLPIVNMNRTDRSNQYVHEIVKDNNCTTKVCIPEIRMIAATPLPPSTSP